MQTAKPNKASVGGWQELQLTYQTKEHETVEVSVVNASARVSALFDDLVLTTEPPLVVQENHYDPWGLNLAGIEVQGNPVHKYQFTGAERQDELGLNWIDLDARQYDPQLGRFHAVDLLADMMETINPYQYAFNNPIRFNDPSGLAPENNSWQQFQNDHYATKGEKWMRESSEEGQREGGTGSAPKSKNVAAYILDKSKSGHDGGETTGDYYEAIDKIIADRSLFGQWHLIVKRSISEIAKELKTNFSAGGIENFILATHGGAGFIVTDTYPALTEAKGGRQLNVKDIGDFNTGEAMGNSDKSSIAALKSIFGLIQKNGKFVLHACNVAKGVGSGMLTAMHSLSGGKTYLYMNTVLGRISLADRKRNYLNIGGLLNAYSGHDYSWMRISPSGVIRRGLSISVNRDSGTLLIISQKPE